MRKKLIPLLSLSALCLLVAAALLLQPQLQSEAQAQTPVPEIQQCSDPLTVPEGSVVNELEDKLVVTLPLGYTYDEARHVFAPEELASTDGALNLRRETWEIDCTCKVAGICNETFNMQTGEASCVLVDCNDCKMTVTEN